MTGTAARVLWAALAIGGAWFAWSLFLTWVRGLGDPWAGGPWVQVKTLASGATERCVSCGPGGFTQRGILDWTRVPGLRALRGQALLDAHDDTLAGLQQERQAWADLRRGSQRTGKPSQGRSGSLARS